MRKKLLAIILIVVLAVAMTACSKKENKDQGEPPKEDSENLEVDYYGDTSLGISEHADKSLEGYKSYLIIGADAGKRSDIMLVISVNEETGDSIMTTIDRDTYMQVKAGEIVTIDGIDYEFCKCNRSYQKGGLRGVMTELNSHLDLNIRDTAVINWGGVANVIDYIGGLDVDVEEEMLPWINNNGDLKEYVDPDKYRIDHAGQQTLTGWQAVQYLRVRKYYGGSARVRAERNESIFKQLLDKTSALSEDDILELYLKESDSLDTNMSFDDMFELLNTFRKSAPESTTVWPYKYETKWDENYHFYYQVPTTLESNVKELHKVLFGQKNYSVSHECKTLSDRIEGLSESILVYSN